MKNPESLKWSSQKLRREMQRKKQKKTAKATVMMTKHIPQNSAKANTKTLSSPLLDLSIAIQEQRE